MRATLPTRTDTTGDGTLVLFLFAIALALALIAPLAFGDVTYNRTRFSVWLALAFAAPATALALLRIGRLPLGDGWLLWWTAALALYLIHFWYGFGVMFAGSFAAAAEAQGTAALINNFVLTVVWCASVIVGWLRLQATLLHALATALLVVNAVTATLVFGRSPSPLIGAAFAVVVVVAAVARAVLAFGSPAAKRAP